ncbi:hypothetical protein CDAR_469111 [Caerostris darwini]|uniref:Uncharacterized protein n=1 Tax=Caerostris darwini TaxID=1538125 RepID=A0AAV4VGN1_9ARAC|nr:hypothetical protein CDAR_469111 [Caerostris darwini]
MTKYLSKKLVRLEIVTISAIKPVYVYRDSNIKCSKISPKNNLLGDRSDDCGGQETSTNTWPLRCCVSMIADDAKERLRRSVLSKPHVLLHIKEYILPWHVPRRCYKSLNLVSMKHKRTENSAQTLMLQ